MAKDEVVASVEGVPDNGDLSLATAAGEIQPAEAAGLKAPAEAVVTEPEALLLPDWRAALNSLTESDLAEFERHPQVHGLVQRREEAARQSVAAQQQRQNEQRLAALSVDDHIDRSMQMIQKGIEEGTDPLLLRRMHKRATEDVALGIQIRAVNEHLSALGELSPPGAQVSEKTQREFDATLAKAAARNGAGPRDVLKATFRYVVEATVNAERQSLESGWKKDYDKRLADERKTAQLKANEEARQNSNGPTNVASLPSKAMDAAAYRAWLDTNPSPAAIDAATAHYLRGT